MRKINNNVKWFILGIIVSLIFSASLISVIASNRQQQVIIEYSNIKITLDTKAVSMKDANGKAIEPFTLDGTTYLPIRSIAETLGLNVDWEEKTNTIALSSVDNSKTSSVLRSDMKDTSLPAAAAVVTTTKAITTTAPETTITTTAPAATITSTTMSATEIITTRVTESPKNQYIGNLNSKKFHKTTCRTLPDEKNRRYFSSRDEAINSGYDPCKNCNP